MLRWLRYKLRARRWLSLMNDWTSRTTIGHCSFCDDAAHLLGFQGRWICRDCYAKGPRDAD